MKYFTLLLIFLLPLAVAAQADKTCVHEMEFKGNVFVKASLPCSWKKEKVTGNEDTRKFLYSANGINYTAVIVVTKLPVVPDSATKEQIISESALRNAGKAMGTVVYVGKIKMGSIPAGELIFKGTKGSGAEKKHIYMLQCYASLDDQLIVMNIGAVATTEKLAQTAFDTNKALFRQYVNQLEVEIDYSSTIR